MIKLKSKKTLPQISKKLRNNNTLINYILNPPKTQDSQIDFRVQVQNAGLNLFFDDIHRHLKNSLISYFKKNMLIPEGVYILLQGALSVIWLRHKQDRCRKQHLFNLARSGIFSTMCQTPYQKANEALEDGFSCLIQTPFSVIESQYTNVLALEDCALLYIPSQILQQTHFYSLYNIRHSLFTSARLPIELKSIKNKVLNINTRLHHTFKRRKFFFHNKFSLRSYGIIQEGSVTYKSKSRGKIQANKQTFLFPFVEYQVCCAELKIIEFINNQTLAFTEPEEIKRFSEDLVKQRNPQKSLSQYFTMKDKKKRKSRQVQRKYEKSLNEIKKMNDREKEKRRKNIASVQKQYQNYFIVPAQMCKTSLKFAKTHNHKFNSNRAQFPPNNKLSYPKRLPLLQIKIQNRSNFTLLQRYENVSRDLYNKFISKNKNK